MPILVKSSKGLRSCSIIKPKSEPTAIEEIIEALKGLTFKLEVRIADIIRSDEPSDTNNQDAKPQSLNVELKAKVENHARETIPAPEVSNESRKVRITPDVVSPEPIVEDVEQTKPKVIAESPIRPDEPQELPSSRRLGKLLIKTETEKIIMPPQVVVKKPTPKKWICKVASGSLKVGATMKTMCISVDQDAKEPTGYVPFDDKELAELTAVICDMARNIEDLPIPMYVEVDNVVFAKSKEDNQWYRACVESVDGDNVTIYFFDWGLREQLKVNRVRLLKHAELDPSKSPACAIRVTFAANTPSEILDEIFKCEGFFDMKVEYYDEITDSYGVVVVKPPSSRSPDTSN